MIYINLTDDEKNALFATDVLGWKLDENNEWTYYDKDFDSYLRMAESEKATKTLSTDTFDPINNLAHAWMGVDKLKNEEPFGEFVWFCRELIEILGIHPDGIGEGMVYDLMTGLTKEAIVEAALRAKGVME